MNPNAAFLLALLVAAVAVSVSGDTKPKAAHPQHDVPDFPWAAGIPGFSGGANNWWGGMDWKNFKMPTSTICKEKGRCYNKKLVCPAKCFKSWKTSSKNGASGSTATCSFDCKKCVATC